MAWAIEASSPIRASALRYARAALSDDLRGGGALVM